MSRRSLRLRLFVGAAVWIVAALVVAGAVIGFLFVRNAERTARAEMSYTLSRLVALLEGSPPLRLSGQLPDPRFQTPLSGLYWQVSEPATGETIRSRSLWDHVLPLPELRTGSGERFEPIAGPGGQSLSALSLSVRFGDDAAARTVLVTVAQDRSSLDEAAGRFGVELSLALAVLAVALILAAWAQVSLGLLPLRRLRHDVERVRQGAAESVPETYPSEIRTLVAEVNELLEAQRQMLDFARRRASDLAHGLKTPLSAMESLAMSLRQGGDARNAGLAEQLSAEMSQRIDYQLRLTRLRHRSRLHALRAPVGDVVRRIVAVVGRTPDGTDLAWHVDIDPRLAVDMDPNDLIELLGVLLENAARWAKGNVWVSAVSDDRQGSVRLTIADDGPGVDTDGLNRLTEAARRHDEIGQHSGLGLAIAAEITRLNNGTIAFERTEQGGLEVTLSLPIAVGMGR